MRRTSRIRVFNAALSCLPLQIPLAVTTTDPRGMQPCGALKTMFRRGHRRVASSHSQSSPNLLSPSHQLDLRCRNLIFRPRFIVDILANPPCSTHAHYSFKRPLIGTFRHFETEVSTWRRRGAFPTLQTFADTVITPLASHQSALNV